MRSTIISILISLGLITPFPYEYEVKDLKQFTQSQSQEFMQIVNDNLRAKEEAARIKREQEEKIAKEIQRQNNVNYTSENVGQFNNITHEEMHGVLSHFGIEDLSYSICEYSKMYNINPFFLASIVGLESGWNTSQRASRGNVTGYMAYSDSAPTKEFSSADYCIQRTAEELRNHYLNSDGIYYNGVSSRAVNMHYCLKQDRKTIDYTWCEKIDTIAYEMVSIYKNKILEV